jgi:hypothetical protein
MPKQDRKNSMWADKGAIPVDGSDAIGVAIEDESGVILSFQHRPASRFYVRLDRLGIRAAEERVVRRSNFVAFDAVLAEQLAEQAASCAVHRVHDKPEIRGTNALPIDQGIERVQIRRADVERSDRIVPRGKRRHAVAQHNGQFLFDLRCFTSSDTAGVGAAWSASATGTPAAATVSAAARAKRFDPKRVSYPTTSPAPGFSARTT